MKKYVILFSAIACMALGLTSCQNEEESATLWENTPLQFRANIESSTDTRCYFKPDMGTIGAMTWDYDHKYGVAEDFPIHILSQSLFEDTQDYTGVYYLDDVSSDNLQATFKYDDGVEFTNGTSGRFWAVSSSFSTAGDLERALAYDSDNKPYLVVEFSSTKYADSYDEKGSCAYTDMEMVAISSSSDPATLNFKQIYGILKINLTLPDGECYTQSFIGYYGNASESDKKPLSGTLGVKFDENDNPSVFTIPGREDDKYNFLNLEFYYNNDNTDGHDGVQTFGLPLFPNSYKNLVFEFEIMKSNIIYTVTKTMDSQATLNIERGKVYTLNLTITQDDLGDVSE